MLAGGRPFEAEGDQAILYRIRNDDPPDLEKLRPEVSRELAAVVRRCLAKSSDERYRDAGALYDDLAATGALPLAARPRGRAPRGRVRPGGPGVSWLRSAVALAAVVIVALGLGWLLSSGGVEGGGGGRSPAVAADAEAILVLPLVPAVPDTALSRLGRELAVTLSASLASVGDITTTEALTVLAQFPEDSVPALEAGANLARRLDARSVLHGTLVRSGGGVRADVRLDGAGDLEPLARVSVTGPAGDVAALTDSIALGLLGRVWRRGEAPVPTLAALTTHSVESLSAYLEGEQAMARAEFDEAVADFERAYAADTTFHFALWRSLYPRVYEGTRLDSARYAALIAHRDEFPTPDRRLIESGLQETLSGTLEARRRLTTEYASYWPGWYALADLLVHQAPPLGTGLEEARAALGRTVELNPDFASAWEHLFWVAVYQRDTTAAIHALAELERFEAPGAFKLNPDLMHYYRTILHLLRNGGTYGEERLELDADYIAGFAGGVPDLGFGIGILDFDFPKAQVQLAEAVLRRQPRRGLTAAMWLGKGLGLAGRGAWDSALVAMDRWVGLTSGGAADEAPDAALVAYGLAVAGVQVGALDSEAAASRRAAAAASPYASEPEGRAELAWLDGLAAHAAGDSAGLAAARRAVAGSGSRFSEWLDGSLSAFQRELGGDTDLAGRELADLEMEAAERTAEFSWASTHPYLMSLDRLAAARWLLAEGDTARASRLLSWHEAEYWSAHRFADAVNSMLAPLALLERARVAEARNDRSRAARDYREFVLRYDLASGSWAAAREEAIAALSR
jgi:hypothetical protein